MFKYTNKYIIILLLLFCCVSCNSKHNESNNIYHLPDTLKVGTLYSPTTFFTFAGDTLGYEYERIRNFAKDKDIQTEFIIIENLPKMIEMLDSCKIDIIAYEIPIIAEFKERVLHCGEDNITYQVLVQPKSDSMITNVIQLIGKEVFVEKDSKYEHRLLNLDNEVGGGINIHSIKQDSIITENLIEMVAEGKIPLTIVDSDIAMLNHTYFKNIDISLSVSLEQRASWAVKRGNEQLADSINEWIKSSESRNLSKRILKRYFELSKNNDSQSELPKLIIKNGKISPYDHLFKKYAKEIGWDWKLLAAQAWNESKFDTTAVSWAGAKGLMQLMPGTAREYGLNNENISNPELNIKAAVANIKKLNHVFAKRIPNEKERIKFIIAAYNSGAGHIIDAIELAKKYGKNPEIWDNNVCVTLQWKANPEYFNDEVCKLGYFRGSQTVIYVEKVEEYYNYFLTQLK